MRACDRSGNGLFEQTRLLAPPTARPGLTSRLRLRYARQCAPSPMSASSVTWLLATLPAGLASKWLREPCDANQRHGISTRFGRLVEPMGQRPAQMPSPVRVRENPRRWQGRRNQSRYGCCARGGGMFRRQGSRRQAKVAGDSLLKTTPVQSSRTSRRSYVSLCTIQSEKSNHSGCSVPNARDLLIRSRSFKSRRPIDGHA
jgi:hypothetical protein